MYRFNKGPLLTVEQVPVHYREKCIISGYRPPASSPLQALRSIFQATNETLNFWTHFLPFWYFMWKLRALAQEQDFYNDHYTWPLLSYLLTSCLYPIVSSTAHAFSCMSHEARHVCFFSDYAALSLYSLGVAIAYRAYSFPDHLLNSTFAHVYLYVAVINSMLCTALACHSRFISHPTWRKVVRLSSFTIPCAWDAVPILYRLLYEADHMASFWAYCGEYALVLGTGLLYASHFPESVVPGRFDIIGHSHQWFHVCSALATVEQMRAVLIDLESRRLYLHDHLILSDITLTFTWSIGAVTLVTITNVLAVCYFTHKLYVRGHRPHDHYHQH